MVRWRGFDGQSITYKRVYTRRWESHFVCTVHAIHLYILIFSCVCVLFGPVIFAVASSIVFVSSVRSLVSSIIWSGRFVHNPHALNDVHLLLLVQFRTFGPAMATINPTNCTYLVADFSSLRICHSPHSLCSIHPYQIQLRTLSGCHFRPPNHNRVHCCVHTVNLHRCGHWSSESQSKRCQLSHSISLQISLAVRSAHFLWTIFIPPNVCCFYVRIYENHIN